MAFDRDFIDGPYPGTKIERRRFSAGPDREQMMKIVPATVPPGYVIGVWWAADEDETPRLCVGLTKAGDVTNKISDDLDTKSEAELLTLAGTKGVKDVKKGQPKGEIIAHIRAKLGEESK